MHEFNLNAIEVALEPFVVTQDSEGLGAAIDSAGCSGITFVINIGESLDTLSGSVYHTFTIQKAIDSAFTSPVDCSASELSNASGTLSAATIVVDDPAEDGVVHILHVTPDADYRYYRLEDDVTGTHTNGTPIGAIAIKHFETSVS